MRVNDSELYDLIRDFRARGHELRLKSGSMVVSLPTKDIQLTEYHRLGGKSEAYYACADALEFLMTKKF